MMDRPGGKKPLIYYYAIVMVVLLLLNALIFPTVMKPRIEETDYGAFLNDVDAGKVAEVNLEGEKIYYSLKDEKEKGYVFVTGQWQDPELVDRLHKHEIKFTRHIPKEMSPLLNFLLTWILPLILFVAIGQYFARRLQAGMGGRNALSFGKSNAKIYVKAESGKTFADVAGQDEAKEALTEIVDFLHKPKKYEDIGASCPKGALLVGPPGTGKTLLAKAVAGEAQVPFFSISGSEFVEMFVGMGAAKVRDLFQQANEKAPCIIFIDEIDTIGKKRDSGGMVGGNDEREQTLNQLLSEMDGFDAKKGVVILAATNRPESLDPALLRPGRFDRRIPVELPDLAGREAVLRVHAKKVKMAADVDFKTIARATAGASGADLENIINESALRAVREGRTTVIQNDLEESVEAVLAGYQRKNAVISPKEKELVSYHEIGHALAAARQSDSAPVHKITIIPRTSGALGYTMQVDEEEQKLLAKDQLFGKLVTLAGGRAAEEIVFGVSTTGAANDIEKMTKMARAMVARFGMSEEFDMVALETVANQYLGGDASLACSPETASKVDAAVIDLVKKAHHKAIDIIKGDLEKLHELARRLLEKETINGTEFMEILHGKTDA